MSDINKALEEILGEITLEQARAMLVDLRSPSTRNAALYNAITNLLKHHKIEVDPVAGARPDHPLGALAHGLPPPDFDEDDANAVH